MVDGQSIHQRASEILVANGGALLPPFQWGEHISIDDGKLDVCIVHARAITGYPSLLLSILLRQQRHNPDVSYMVAEERVTIDANRKLPVQADGEFIGETPVHIQIVPGAVQVIVPVTKNTKEEQ